MIGRFLSATFVLLFYAAVSHIVRVVGGLRQAISKVEKILRDSDCAQKLVVQRRIFHVIVVVVHKELFTHAHHYWILQDLLTSRSELGLHLYQ